MSAPGPSAPTPLALTTYGDGAKPVILVHGFLGSGRNLRSLAQRWFAEAPDHRFLMPDLRGHGSSPGLPEDADLDLLARDVLVTAAQAGVGEGFALVGHSLGGRVGLAVARAAPERVSELTLLDIPPGPVSTKTSESRRILDLLLAAPEDAADRREMRAFFLGRGLSPALSDWLLMNLEAVDGRYRWRIDRGALDRLHDRFSREDLWPVIEAGQVPVRCARGGQSSYVTDADVERLERHGCPVITLANAGHYLHADTPEDLVTWLRTG